MDIQPGEICPKCEEGTFRAYKSLIKDFGNDKRARVRYYSCSNCGFKPKNNKQIIPIEYAPRKRLRIKMRKPSTKFGNRNRGRGSN